MKLIEKRQRLSTGIFISLLALVLPLSAQQPGGDMSVRQQMLNLQHRGMQQMNQLNMQMSMDQMMKQMNEMLSHTGEMVKSAREHDEHGQGSLSGPVRPGMAVLSGHLDAMARGMQKTLGEMRRMMADESLMNDPLVKKHMHEMQGNMGRMMSAMEDLLKSMDTLHTKKENE
ncbi:MAG TPA: hypothetical protein ENJ15_04930 [Caldithrix abyssi]|uniref:DUF4175 domain-containing protein n=1 Tax=Caldithrix abyssi TaxID=187145 RepID=A0A7V5RPF6_CALAY|nr:hypothetical protein [Caldithrix abyssi]